MKEGNGPMKFTYEHYGLKGYHFVIGVDEAGRGPLAGPVVAGAFCFFEECLNSSSQFKANLTPAATSEIKAEEGDMVDGVPPVREEVKLEEVKLADHAVPHVAQHDDPMPEGDATDDEEGEDGQRAILEESISSSEAEAELPVTGSEIKLEEKQRKRRTEKPMPPQSREPGTTREWMKKSPWCHIADSKQLVESDREELYDAVAKEDGQAVVYASASSLPPEIDRVDILQATLRSMTRAVYSVMSQCITRCWRRIDWNPETKFRFKILVDGNRRPPFLDVSHPLPENHLRDLMAQGDASPGALEWTNILNHVQEVQHELVIKGDAHVMSIAAASIIAKVERDREMRRLAALYPQYHLDVHKGYPTPEHKKLVHELGVSAIHRLSFSPIYQAIQNGALPCPPERQADWEIVQKRLTSKKAKKKQSGKQRGGTGRQTTLIAKGGESHQTRSRNTPATVASKTSSTTATTEASKKRRRSAGDLTLRDDRRKLPKTVTEKPLVSRRQRRSADDPRLSNFEPGADLRSSKESGVRRAAVAASSSTKKTKMGQADGPS